jgi:hypothetical protein
MMANHWGNLEQKKARRRIRYNNGQVASPPQHNKLITALRTAVGNGEDVLDEQATSHDDLLDAFRLSLWFGIEM